MRLFQNQSSLPMLPFHEHIIGELLQDDNGGLVVLGSGLGLHKIIASLIRLHSHSDGLLFILSTSDSQRRALVEDLRLAAPIDIDSQYSSQDRVEFYSQGGVFFITSRILVVDLLNEKVPLSRVAGLILVNAHRLTETCTETFIARLYRFGNKKGYVRAFSDRPQSMVAGFSKTERIMKCLFIRKLHLWPRFQVFVSDILEKDPPEVIDVRMPQTSLMSGIQSAIIEVMDACLKELRKTNKVDVEDLTVESGLFKSFDEIVRQQLDPIWHIIGKKTKQLVRDLKTLRKLADYLVRYDAVTYLKYLDALRVSEGVRSVWIFANPSHRIFELAKKRVYQVVRSDGGRIGSANGLIKSVSGVRGDASKRRKINANDIKQNKATEASTSDSNGDTSNDLSKEASGVELEVVGEEMPKWKVLREVLEEIEEERMKQKVSEAGLNSSQDAGDDGGGAVLVACKDERSSMQLQDCIYRGPQKDGRCPGPNAPTEPISGVSQNALTRKAGGRKAPEKQIQVIVDMREFRSNLPSVLHQQGMKIIPVTLEVGDYILSPDICVERKSIADLISSFFSGRLYHQAETMTRYYRIPVLLIEFSQDKSFCFQSANDIGEDISPFNIISKLCLLVLHFPRLRLVWSRSLHATAEIFASLKANQDEPDVSTAMRVGVPTEDGLIEGDIRAENYNTTAVEFLRRLPGVTDANYRSLMDGCKSLAELALLPLERLAELMGGQRPARMLRDFLDAKCPSLP